MLKAEYTLRKACKSHYNANVVVQSAEVMESLVIIMVWNELCHPPLYQDITTLINY